MSYSEICFRIVRGRARERENLQFAFVTRRPYYPGRPKKLCFTTQSLAVKTVGARLSVVKQSFFGLPGQYGRRVIKANDPCTIWVLPPFPLDWSFTARHCLTRRKELRSPIATEKHERHKPTFRSKNPRIIASKLNLEWGHLFRTFFTWFRRKNDLGGLETRTKGKTKLTRADCKIASSS